MATGGWGAMGAWGPSAPAADPADDPNAPAAHASAAPLYGGPPDASASHQPSSGYTGAFGGAYANTPEPYYNNATAATYTNSSAFGGAYAGTGGASNVSAREAELNAKEAALKKREEQLKKMEKDMLASGQMKKKNWPICFPMCYHNIADEIPDGSKRVVREVYFAWYGLIVCLCWNFFCASVILGSDESDKVASWFLAVIYALAGIPLSFILWYRCLYNGAKVDSAFGYIRFFICFSVHLGFCIWAAIGVPIAVQKWAFAGFIPALQAFDVSTFAGVIYLIGASFWAAESAFSFWCLKDVFLFFRGAGKGPQKPPASPQQHQVDLEAFKQRTEQQKR